MDARTRTHHSGASLHAGFWNRFLARLIDGALCIFVLTTVAGVVASLTSDAVFYPVLFGIVLAYFGIGPLLGGTLGEQATSLRVVDAGGDRPPGILQAAVRSIGSTAMIVSGTGILMFGFSDTPDGGYGSTAVTILSLMGVLFALSILARFWMLVDRDHRTLTDRLAGVTVLRRPPRERPSVPA